MEINIYNTNIWSKKCCRCCLVAESRLTPCGPMDSARQVPLLMGFPW